MPAKVPQVLIRPRRANLTVEARLRMIAVPAKPKSIAIDASGRFERMNALGDERVRRLGHIVLKRNRFSPISDPAAHARYPARRLCGYRAATVASPIQHDAL